MKISVREVLSTDAEAVTKILNPIVEEGRYTVIDKVFTIEEERKFIESFPVRGVFKVAVFEQDSLLVGFQTIEPFATYTQAFDHVGVIGTYVDAGYRNLGVANRLFESTFASALSKDYRKLFAYVRADNKAALSVYQKHGFSIIGVAKDHAFRGGRYVDEIFIEKFL